MLLFGCFLPAARCQSLTGTVRTLPDSLPLPDAVIRVKNTPVGAVAGPDGRFTLKLQPGKYLLVVTYLGYKTLETEIQLRKNQDTTLRFFLTESPYELGTVYISPDGKDPAYHIIRRVSDNRDSLRKLAPLFTYKAYTKTRIEVLKLAKFLKKGNPNLKTDTAGGANILFLSENFSDVAVSEPDKISETITASRVSGQKDRYSLFSSLFLRFNIFQNFIRMPGVSERGFISPISDNTFLYYDFKLLGSEKLEGQTCWRIEVKPKRKYDPVFAGTLWIADSVYTVEGLDLFLTGDRQADQIDSLRIRQFSSPFPVKNEKFTFRKPINIRFDFTGGPSMAKFGGYSTSVFSDYDFKDSFPPKTFTSEVMKVNPDAVNLPDSFWVKSRPTGLDSKESNNYRVKDSLEEMRNSPRYLDSLSKARSKFGIGSVLFGYRYYSYRTEQLWQLVPIFEGLSFNASEGLALELSGQYRFRLSDHYRMSIRPAVRYGTASRHLNGKMTFQLQEGGGRKGRFRSNQNTYEISFGRYVESFSPNQISAFWNSIYSLIGGQNFLRLYRQDFFKAGLNRTLRPGLTLKASLTTAYRTPMPTVSDYSWHKNKLRFEQNILFNPHFAVVAETELSFRPGVKFISTPDGNIDLGSKYPVVSWKYKKGMGWGADFDFMRLEVADRTSLRLLGTLRWSVSGGIFLNYRRVFFPDYYHFRDNQILWRNADGVAQYGLMNYYAYSTSQKFAEFHAEHSFDGFLFNKIPGIRKLKWGEIAGIHYLKTDSDGEYAECHFGIEKIFRLIRVDYHYRLKGKSFARHGITFYIDFSLFNRSGD